MTLPGTLKAENRPMSRLFMLLRAITRGKKSNASSFRKNLARSLNRRLKSRRRKPSRTRRQRRR